MTPQTFEIPTLETARLVLRPPQPETDWGPFEAMMTSERARYMGGPFSREGAWGGFCHAAATWAYYGRGTLFAERKDTGQLVGETGLNDGPLFPETEIGWSIFAEKDEGQGFATEAAGALRDWAYSQGGLTTLVSYTHPDNHASQAVAQRLGCVRDDAAPRQDEEDIVWRHPSPEALKG
ncbi:MAG: GNAT family N-acetyltransferase [Pseudomonadota bacterium]